MVLQRDDLKLAVLRALGDIGPAGGYAILAAVRQQLSGRWSPTPGSLYPVLLALEDDRLILGVDSVDGRFWTLTSEGEDVARGGTLALTSGEGVALATYLDDLVPAPLRRRRVPPEVAVDVAATLAAAAADIERLLDRRSVHG